MELLGRTTCPNAPGNNIYQSLGPVGGNGFDPYAYVLSKNVHRRHLNAEQKHKLIAEVLKAKPEISNRQIAKQVKVNDKKVARVRTELEATAAIPQLEKTTGADGKARPARKAPPMPPLSSPTKATPRRPKSVVRREQLNPSAWNDASPAERAHFVNNIGWHTLAEAIPPDWYPIIEKWLEAPRPTTMAAPVDHSGDLAIPSDLSIPAFLQPNGGKPA